MGFQAGRGSHVTSGNLIRPGLRAYVEKVALEALDRIERRIQMDAQGNATPGWVRASFKFRKPAVTKTVGDFNTPNSQNVTRVFDWSFGFDPRPSWVWDSPRRQWTTATFSARTDEWLRIRHTIAHGNELPSNVPWIRNGAGTARLTLDLLKECQRHFRELARRTDRAFITFLRTEYGIRRMGPQP